VFKEGDLVKFNDRGLALFKFVSGSIAVIASDAKKVYEYDFSDSNKIEFYTYNILVSGQLFNDIPDEFLKRITEKDEKNS